MPKLALRAQIPPRAGLFFRFAKLYEQKMFEDPCSKLQGIFDRKEICHFQIRSLTPQQATGNALAFPVQ